MPAAKRRRGGKGARAVRPEPPGPAAAADRVAEERAAGTPAALRADLVRLLGPDKVLGRITDLVAYASDASPYRFVPHAVVVPDSVQDVVRLMAYARSGRRHLVFRAAGTSLTGQAQGEDILVDVRRHFSGVEVEAGGARARVLPGTVLARADAALARHGRVLGPDPASAAAATVGGVLATNAAGPAAGPERDAYRTVASLTVVLASGTVVDTGDPDADAGLAAAEPELCQGLLDLRDEIEADAALSARIRDKCAVRGPGGYRLDAFLDGETPAQILRGLMIGSQGTLGFVAESVWTTLPARPAVSAALLYFPSLPAAAAAVPLFAQAGAEVVDLVDGRAVQDPGRDGAGADALLVEFRAADDVELAAYERAARRICDDLGLVAPAPPADNAFTREPGRIAEYRAIRTAAASVSPALARPAGAVLVTAAVAVPQDRFAEACAELAAAQQRHDYDAALLSGHAARGSLHLRLPLDLAQPGAVERWAAFIDDLCETFAERFDGCASFTAEHGTGRAGAPFLEREWGPQATALMWRVKALLDPDGILAPHVVLDHDPRGHLRGLKSRPATGTAADGCTECGLCEPVCPSRDFTTTPRQRIVLRREMARQPAGSPVLRALLDAYDHDAVDTCAGDGLCGLVCPLGIDTGAVMARLSAGRRPRATERAAAAVAGRAPRTAERAVRAAVGAGGAPRLPRTGRDGATAVYYPSCAHRVLGPPAGGDAVWAPQALVTVSARAGLPVWIPPDVPGTCCGGTEAAANRLVERAWMWTGGGRLPIVADSGACALRLTRGVLPHLTDANREMHGELTVIDAVAWAAERLLPRLTVTDPAKSAVLHPTCAMRHLGTVEAFEAVARACAAEVVTPGDAGCCGASGSGSAAGAGARGAVPAELIRVATRREAEEVAARGYELHLSGDRLCEGALALATGEGYESVVVALERVTRRPGVPG